MERLLYINPLSLNSVELMYYVSKSIDALLNDPSCDKLDFIFSEHFTRIVALAGHSPGSIHKVQKNYIRNIDNIHKLFSDLVVEAITRHSMYKASNQ